MLYLDPTVRFPETKEKHGYFVGFAENSGDALTYKILKDDMKTVLVRSVVRPANTIKDRNRRVTFNDNVEEILDNLDENYQHQNIILPLEVPKDDESLEDIPNQIPRRPTTRNSKKQENDIATRTRSKRRLVGALNTSTIKALNNSKDTDIATLLEIPTMMFFILLQFLLWIPINAAQQISDVCNHGDYKGAISNTSSPFIDQLKYLNALDSINEKVKDPWNMIDIGNEELWDVKKVIKHRTKDGKTEVKVIWKDPNKSSSWINMYALAIQDPSEILRYAKTKHLLSQKPFSVLVERCIGDSPSRLAKAFKAKVKSNGKKYKFSIRVPFGLKQAIQLDKENGNTLWFDAIKRNYPVFLNTRFFDS